MKEHENSLKHEDRLEQKNEEDLEMLEGNQENMMEKIMDIWFALDQGPCPQYKDEDVKKEVQEEEKIQGMQKQKLYLHENRDEGQEIKGDDLCKQTLGHATIKYQDQKKTLNYLLQHGFYQDKKVKLERQDYQRELQFEHEQSMKLTKNPKQVESKQGLINKTEKAPTQKRETVLCNLCGESLSSVFFLKIPHTGDKASLDRCG